MALLSGRKSSELQPRIRSSSQFCAFTRFVLTDYVIGLVEIEFLLLTIISVTSEDSSGIAVQWCRWQCYQAGGHVLTDCVVGVVEIGFLLSPMIVCSIREFVRHGHCNRGFVRHRSTNGVDGNGLKEAFSGSLW